MPRSAQRFLVLPILCILAVPFPAHAETKVLTADGTYTMGEGETMTFAESMALQKAKQTALEQAGTYVESYTKVQNYQLTAEEIQTVAGGVLQVEVLEKKRELIGNGLKFFVKIKATVTTDKVAELAQRIKGKNVAEEYKKLQADYARLAKEIETYKQLIAKTPSGSERDAALDQIREREKGFIVVQKNEVAFIQRLVSGEELLSKATGQLTKKSAEIASVDALIHNIVKNGYLISIGQPNIRASLIFPNEAEILIPVTVSGRPGAQTAIRETARSLGGKVEQATLGLIGIYSVEISKDFEIVLHFRRRMSSLVLELELQGYNGPILVCHIPDWTVKTDPIGILFKSSTSFTVRVVLPLSQAGQIRSARSKVAEQTQNRSMGASTWHSLRGDEETVDCVREK